MGKGKYHIFKLLIVVISVLTINSGKLFPSVSNEFSILSAADKINDIELLQEHNHISFQDDDNWAKSVTYNFSHNNKPVNISCTLNCITEEFSDSIWQPPKSI
jgi:hypothetical protein